MHEQLLIPLLLWSMLGVFLLTIVVIITYLTRSGRIRQSPLATRREKNLRHLMTLITLAIALSFTALCLLIDRRIGGYFLFSSAFFALFIAPLRSIFIEAGIRRTMRTASDTATPAKFDLK